jgi:predicted transposase YbfD/YdcC
MEGSNMKPKSAVNKVIVEFKEIVANLNFSFDLEFTPVKPMKKLLKLFSSIDDARVEARITYPLGELLLIAFLAIMSGADSFVLIEKFCFAKFRLLQKFIPQLKYVPSHDTFRRVFTLFSPESLQMITVSYLLDNIKMMRRVFGIDEAGLRHYSVDGKTANGSGRLPNTAVEINKIHTLHVYDNTDSVCLISKPVGEKTNEIPVAQEVLALLDLKNVVVTFDALNTQKKTIEVITAQKGLYIGALKKNHQDFFGEVESYFNSDRLRKIKEQDKGRSSIYLSYSEKAHNRIETRTYWLTKNVAWLTQVEEWDNLKAVVRYKKESVDLVTGKKTNETYFYISSLDNVKDCADFIRAHWAVENELHWHLDANMGEDSSSIVDRKAFQNFSLMNKLTLSLLKLSAPILKSSVKSTRHIAAWGLEAVLRTLCVFDEDALKAALLTVKPDAGKKSRLKIPEDY